MSQWTARQVNPLELVLDKKNDRIELASNAKQQEIREALFATEDVDDLIEDIIEIHGLLPTERIVVVEESGKLVVLEGNRRVCACQAILDVKTIPPRYKDRFLLHQNAASTELRNLISNIEVVVAPSREAADVAITRKHTDPKIKPWSPQAKYRRIKRLMRQGKSLDEIVTQFKQSRTALVRTLRELGILEYATSLPVWTSSESTQLKSPKLKTNAFTRFYTLGGVCIALELEFDDNGKVKEPKDPALLRRAIELIARLLLLEDPDTTTGKPKFNTRASTDEVFAELERRDERLRSYIKRERTESQSTAGTANQNQQKTSAATSSRKDANDTGAMASGKFDKEQKVTSAASGNPDGASIKPGPLPKVAKFFEDLECHVDDDVLKTYAREIRVVDYKGMPTAAAFLMRGLVEHMLKWLIRSKELNSDLKAFLHKKGGVKKLKSKCPECSKAITVEAPQYVRDPGLSDLIEYCSQNAAKLFDEPVSMKRNLDNWKFQSKDYVDIVIHGHFIIASKEKLIDAAKNLRPFSKAILHKKSQHQPQSYTQP